MTDYHSVSRPMDGDELKALERVIEYLRPTERRDYDSNPREDHIFLALNVLLDYYLGECWEIGTAEGIANGDMEQLPNGKVRFTEQGRAKYEAEKVGQDARA